MSDLVSELVPGFSEPRQKVYVLGSAWTLVVASSEGAFAELFIKRGLVVDFGGSWVLTRLLPLNKAKELALLGDTI